MFARPVLLALALLACAGCASPPSPLDATPRFRHNATRVEGAQCFVELSTKVKDWRAHLGVTWDARVAEVFPQGGARIEATLTCLDLQLPTGIGFNTKSLSGFLRLGHGPIPLAPLLTKLVGKRFSYTVSAKGEVEVYEWSSIVEQAARESELEAPQDGTIPSQSTLARAISRAYGAMPHAQVQLGGETKRAVDFPLEREGGPRVHGQDSLSYRGFGEAEVEATGDEWELEGLELSLRGQARAEQGETRHGVVKEGPSLREGMLLLSDDGGELLLYREQTWTELHPNTSIGWLDGIELARLSMGWLVYAESRWN